MTNKARVYNSATLKRFMDRSNPSRRRRVEQQMLLANVIYNAMRSKGWNQEMFAQKMQKLPSEISKWLSGTHNFTVDTLFDISDVLGVSLINLKGRKNENNIFVVLNKNNGELADLPLNGLQISPQGSSNYTVSYGKGEC